MEVTPAETLAQKRHELRRETERQPGEVAEYLCWGKAYLHIKEENSVLE